MHEAGSIADLAVRMVLKMQAHWTTLVANERAMAGKVEIFGMVLDQTGGGKVLERCRMKGLLEIK